MPVGMLRDYRAQLRQIIARERAALEADRFHCPQVLCHPGPRVQQQMSKLQGRFAETSVYARVRTPRRGVPTKPARLNASLKQPRPSDCGVVSSIAGHGGVG